MPIVSVFVCWRWSVCSWDGGFEKCVGFQRSGVRYPYVAFNAMNVAFMKLPLVRVCPHEQEKQSATPENCSIFFSTGEPMTPEPRGAGMSLTRTEPHFPETFIGTPM